MRRFQDLVKEIDFDEMLVMLHGTGLPSYESMTKFCEIYSAVLNCRMRLTTKLLLKIDVVGENNDAYFYGIDCSVHLGYECLRFLKSVDNKINRLKITMGNLAQVSGLFIPDAFINEFGSNFIVYLLLKELEKTYEPMDYYMVDEEHLCNIQGDFRKRKRVFINKINADYKYLSELNKNNYLFLRARDEGRRFYDDRFKTRSLLMNTKSVGQNW